MSRKFISIFDKRLSVLPTPPTVDTSAGHPSTPIGQLASSKLQQTRQQDQCHQSPQKKTACYEAEKSDRGMDVNGGTNLLETQAQSPSRHKTGKSDVQGTSQTKAPFV